MFGVPLWVAEAELQSSMSSLVAIALSASRLTADKIRIDGAIDNSNSLHAPSGNGSTPVRGFSIN